MITKERQNLINRFQKWFDTNPNPKLLASQCANIAESYAHNKNTSLDKDTLYRIIMEAIIMIEDGSPTYAKRLLEDLIKEIA